MLFDKIAGIAERTAKSLLPTLKAAKLFQFDSTPPEAVYQGEETNITKDFFLPFKTIAIENKESLTILRDFVPGQIGLDCQRYFFKAVSIDRLKNYLRKTGQTDFADRMGWIPKNSYQVHSGVIESAKEVIDIEDGSRSWVVEGNASIIYMNKKRGLFNPDNDVSEPSLQEKILLSIVDTYDEISIFNDPGKFILETRPVKKRKNRNKRYKIERTNERPRYTILSPGKIRHRMGITTSTRPGTGTKRPHERRSHAKYLKSYRYSKKGSIPMKKITYGSRKGEIYYRKVIVPATWVGESEKTIGNKKYKVILDETT